jgi:hypothetical protein
MNLKASTTSSIRKIYDLIKLAPVILLGLVVLLSCGLIFL